jgi:hypothetical protein
VRLAFLILTAVITWAGDETLIRKLVAKGGDVRLPSGEFILTRPITVPRAASLRGSDTILRMSPKFEGPAMLICQSGATIEDLTLLGNRDSMTRRIGIAPSDRAFISFYDRNGIVAEDVTELVIRNVLMKEIPNFAIIVAASKNVTI